MTTQLLSTTESKLAREWTQPTPRAVELNFIQLDRELSFQRD